jgi:hypothetical protein
MTCPQLDACIPTSAGYVWGKPDVVYLWVDGNDPAWQAQRRSHALLYPDIVQFGYSNVDGRFRDIGELKYSLRSLTRHLDRIGTIYLVTDDQRPAWLADHPQLRLVSHREIRAETGPTFSSICLESSVHRIPELSENFIYLNDDLFLGETFSISHLFSGDGRFRLYFDDNNREPISVDPYQWHCIHAAISKSILSKAVDGYTHYDAGFAHTPRAFSTSAIKHFEQLFPDAFASARAEVFRASKTPSVLVDMHQRWLHATGAALIASAPLRLIHSDAADLQHRLDDLVAASPQLAFFCINDTLDNAPSDHPAFAKIQQTLETLFPTPSPFETAG